MTWELFAVFLGSSIRLATPLLLAGIGETGERTGRRAQHEHRGHDADRRFAAAVGSWATGESAARPVDRHPRGAAGRAAAGRC